MTDHPAPSDTSKNHEQPGVNIDQPNYATLFNKLDIAEIVTLTLKEDCVFTWHFNQIKACLVSTKTIRFMQPSSTSWTLQIVTSDT